jgi:ABC-2 type transport system permease protein
VSIAETTAGVVMRRESLVRSTVDYYLTTIRTQLQTQFQYRAATYMYMVALVAEPVIYLVVWTTIARSHGGTVQGIGVWQLAAYYVVWTLVRGWNVVFTPFGWEWRVREGELSASMLRPIHPIHFELAWWAGQKLVWLVM